MDRYKEVVDRMGLPTEPYKLGSIVGRYPWFMTVRILRNATTGKSDSILEPHLMAHPTPLPLLKKISIDEFIKDNCEQFDADDVIERFLNKNGEHKVKPCDTTPDLDVSEKGNVFELTDELATEQLADVYLSQGLVEEANAIYHKLGIEPKKRS